MDSWIEWTDMSFRGLDLNKLKVDECFFNVSNKMAQKYFMYTLSDECIACPYKLQKVIQPKDDTVVKLDTSRGMEVRLCNRDFGRYMFPNHTHDGVYWTARPDLGEFGVYDFIIMESGANRLEVAKDPVPVHACK